MKTILALILFLLFINSFAQQSSPYHYKIPSQINDGLKTTTLSDVGIDSTNVIGMTDKIIKNEYINIHSVLIVRNDKLAYENYFPGYEDFFYGDSSLVDHHRDSLHEIRSITKSIVSACIGIAIAQGEIKSVNETIFQYFPEYSRYNTGMKQNITIKHLLTMSSGIQWYEGDSGATNQEVTMMHSPNPVEYFLSQPMANPPGKVWNYNGGCTQTLAAILKKVTGEEIDSFVNKHIFLPLGITKFKWDKTKTGFYWCAGGIWLRSRDIAKFGLLYINDGKWNGKAVIPSSWISESLHYYFKTTYPETNYGYQFWGADVKINNELATLFAGQGNGGQIVLLYPKKKTVIVVTAGNFYNPPLSWQSYNMIATEIFPAIK